MRKLVFLLGIVILTAVGCRAEITSEVSESTAEARMAQTNPLSVPLLGKEEAERIALEYVQLTADQVERLQTHYEIDDGVPQYDVEFYEGQWEYEFELHAETGDIISYDKDAKND